MSPCVCQFVKCVMCGTSLFQVCVKCAKGVSTASRDGQVGACVCKMCACVCQVCVKWAMCMSSVCQLSQVCVKCVKSVSSV